MTNENTQARSAGEGTLGAADAWRSEATLGERAYVLIRDSILRSELHPSELVTESKLVRKTGIGKTPVREALARLGSEGLLVARPRLGYEVAPVTLGAVRDLFSVRQIVEPAAAELAAVRISAETLERLRDLCEDRGYSPESVDGVDEWIGMSHDFHVTVAAASGNPRLTSLVERLVEESHRYLYVGMRLRFHAEEHRVLHRHLEIVEALADRDPLAVADLLRDHITHTERNVTAALLTSPSLQTAPVVAAP